MKRKERKIRREGLFHSAFRIAMACWIAFLSHQALAQFAKPVYDASLLFRGLTGLSMNGALQSWNVKGIGTVEQQSAPLSLSVPLFDRVLLSVANAPAVAKFDTAKVEGVTDTRLTISYVVPGDKLWLNGGISLPTGKTKLTSSQVNISTIISQTAFGYRVPVFGQGLNGNAGFAFAVPVSRRVVIGFGSSYLYKGMYEPVVAVNTGEKVEYSPGSEISGNIGGDYTSPVKQGRFSLDVTVTYYFIDKLNDQDLFQSGVRTMALLMYSLRTDNLLHTIFVRARIRGENNFYTTNIANKYKSAQQVEGQYSLAIPLAKWIVANGIVEAKSYTPDQVPIGATIVETGRAELVNGGVDVQLPVSPVFVFTLSGRYGKGSVTIDGVHHSVDGTEIGGGLRIVF